MSIIQKTEEVIKSMCSEERAKNLFEFIEKIGAENYFSAPASSNEQYHNCFPGGLAEHNLNVLENLISLCDVSGLDVDPETICVIAILHDIGKVLNTDLKSFYVPQTEKWRLERGEIYFRDEGSVYFPTHQRSLWLIYEFGFKLSVQEYQAILLNDGQYINENKSYAHKETDIAKLLHMADMMALLKEKRNETQK
jgi:hypothetical protein